MGARRKQELSIQSTRSRTMLLFSLFLLVFFFSLSSSTISFLPATLHSLYSPLLSSASTNLFLLFRQGQWISSFIRHFLHAQTRQRTRRFVRAGCVQSTPSFITFYRACLMGFPHLIFMLGSRLGFFGLGFILSFLLSFMLQFCTFPPSVAPPLLRITQHRHRYSTTFKETLRIFNSPVPFIRRNL